MAVPAKTMSEVAWSGLFLDVSVTLSGPSQTGGSIKLKKAIPPKEVGEFLFASSNYAELVESVSKLSEC